MTSAGASILRIGLTTDSNIDQRSGYTYIDFHVRGE